MDTLLNKFKVTELRKLVKLYNLDVKIVNYHKMKKDDLIKEIKKHITTLDDLKKYGKLLNVDPKKVNEESDFKQKDNEILKESLEDQKRRKQVGKSEKERTYADVNYAKNIQSWKTFKPIEKRMIVDKIISILVNYKDKKYVDDLPKHLKDYFNKQVKSTNKSRRI